MVDRRYTGTEKSTIAISTTTGSAVRIGEAALVGLILPSTWTAQTITFEVSPDNITWYALQLDDANTVVTVPQAAAVASKAIAMNTILDKLAVWNWIRPVSGSAQTNATYILFVLKA